MSETNKSNPEPMIDKRAASLIKKTLCSIVLLLTGAGCAGFAPKSETAFDPAGIEKIHFRFDHAEGLGNHLPAQQITTQVSANLSEWHYPLTAGSEYSHLMTVVVGPIEHGPTPTGFSFTAGNSNPRALDFQKSDVLPITCILSPKEHQEQRAEMRMDVMAGDYRRYARQAEKHQELVKMLVNDISTVCFNLLDGLDVKTRQRNIQEATEKPGWIPEIRVEVDDTVDTENPVAPTNANEPLINSNVDDTKSTTTKPRKRIIIHNQGTPVIFKFGYERK